MGSLFGIPILIKDNIETLELPTTAGSLALIDNVTARDADVVARLRAADAIILGKANLSEWANFRSTKSSSGWSAVGGLARNPHNELYSASGSSSGSAVAVAALLCVAAVGTETLGSVVSPASACGVVGVKPGIGLVSQNGIVPISHSQDTAGPISRSVGDASLMLAAMLDRPHIKSNAAGDTDVGSKEGRQLADKKLGLLPFSTGFNPQVDALFDKAQQALVSEGATIIPRLTLDMKSDITADFLTYSLYEFKHGINKYLAGLPNELNILNLESLIRFNAENAGKEMPHFMQEIFEQAQAKGPLTDPEYLEIVQRIGPMTSRAIEAMLEQYALDAIIAPTQGPSWLIDLVGGDAYSNDGIITGLAAIAGYPHLTVPMGKVDGLPVGLSLIGGKESESSLLDIAQSFETVLHLDRYPAALIRG